MPNINEFINPEPPKSEVPVGWKKINGSKPCYECDLDAEFYYWDPLTYTMIWNCTNGHSNTFRVNN
jgi:hypothetical protein